MNEDAPARYLMALLFDASARAEHRAHPARAMAAFGLTADQARAFEGLDLERVEHDARGRRRYLMSATCRAFPLSAGALGSAPGGPDRLAAFLAGDSAQAGAAVRTAAFGDHLRRLLELDVAGGGPQVVGYLRPFLELEAGLVQTAAHLRAAVAAGRQPPGLRKWKPRERRLRGLVLPPHLLVVTLPTSPEVLRAALYGISAADAWQRIRGGDLSWSRVVAVARAASAPGGSQPVTILARALVHGQSVARGGSGGVAPIVDVRHRTVEIAGAAPGLLRQCDGTMRLQDLPARQRRLAEGLLDAGLLSLGSGLPT